MASHLHMANNETYTCSPSEVCLSDSDSELLIPTPWSHESKNEKREKDKGPDVMKDKVSQENVCEEEVIETETLSHWSWMAGDSWKMTWSDVPVVPSDERKKGCQMRLNRPLFIDF
ncbi:hypothetical protein Tco_0317621 [Tanacetum coccineum]